MKQAERNQQNAQQQQQMKDLISQQVFQSLGQPDKLQSVQVRHLWSDHFRVNVMVGNDAASAQVAHSYFLMVDNAGSIVNSIPLIRKLY
jgi:hypothetical protein